MFVGAGANATKFPRVIKRGLIEASLRLNRDEAAERRFPRVIKRGLIEARNKLSYPAFPTSFPA